MIPLDKLTGKAIMKTVQYGEFKISVDIEKTREYYRNYTVPDTQANRNLAKYCETLSDGEREFFDAFAIDPVCCEIEHIGVSKKGDFPCGGYYLVCGEYLEYPPENLVTVEQLAANGFEDDRSDPRINIGIFQFDFQCPEYEINDIPEDMPEGFICIRFWCEEMKWLLDEEPEERMYEPPRFWEVRRKLKERKARREQEKIDSEEAKKEFCRAVEELNTPFDMLDEKEVRAYRKAWIDAFSPSAKDRRKIRKVCISSRRFTKYLWHIFSYEFLPCKEKEEAKAAYAQTERGGCVLHDNISRLACRFENGSALTPDVLGSFEDVTVTADDFSWTYSKTHEEYCGPYFYKK